MTQFGTPPPHSPKVHVLSQSVANQLEDQDAWGTGRKDHANRGSNQLITKDATVVKRR
jgi:hypothetical protein